MNESTPTTPNNLPALAFQHITFDVIHQQGDPWLKGYQIGSALGLAQPGAAVSKLYERNSDEFNERMTALVSAPTASGQQLVRIFSLRGAYLLGMLCNTDQAKEFRAWALDRLEELHRVSPIQAELVRVGEQVQLLRELVIASMADEHPQWRQVARLHAIEGLTHAERALLMGWGADRWRTELRKLDALGLLQYQPNPGRSEGARRVRAEQVAERGQQPRAARNPLAPRKATYRPTEEHMAKMRAGLAAKKQREAKSAPEAKKGDSDDDSKLH